MDGCGKFPGGILAISFKLEFGDVTLICWFLFDIFLLQVNTPLKNLHCTQNWRFEKIIVLFNSVIFRFHVNFPGCTPNLEYKGIGC